MSRFRPFSIHVVLGGTGLACLAIALCLVDGRLLIGQMQGSSSRNSGAGIATRSNSKIQKVVKSDQQWRSQLSELDYRVTRQKGTEPAFSGKYWNNNQQGTYTCKCCKQSLFDANSKFKSGTGWPSYYQPVKSEHINHVRDLSHGMNRVEVTCSRCDAHLGHVFRDGPQPTGLRYCINSASLGFAPKKAAAQPVPAKTILPGANSKK